MNKIYFRRDNDSWLEKVRETFEIQSECGRSGHVEGEIILGYQHALQKNVVVACRNCGAPYSRPPTLEERRAYQEMTRIVLRAS
jgi:hypothetical protein